MLGAETEILEHYLDLADVAAAQYRVATANALTVDRSHHVLMVNVVRNVTQLRRIFGASQELIVLLDAQEPADLHARGPRVLNQVFVTYLEQSFVPDRIVVNVSEYGYLLDQGLDHIPEWLTTARERASFRVKAYCGIPVCENDRVIRRVKRTSQSLTRVGTTVGVVQGPLL